MAIEEFSLIERYFIHNQNHRQATESETIDLGIGDDGAILSPPPGQRLCVAVDTLVAGVHFPFNTSAYDIGYKALAVNLSDLAAMGASPYAFTLALTLPNTNPAWLQGFSDGLLDLAQCHQLKLIGGDTTRGPLTLSVQVLGLLPRNQALLRSGAKVGDDVYVSGHIGDAGLGLKILQGELHSEIDATHRQHLLARLNQPSPRLELGKALLNLANSAVDVSDGLLVDLKHILDASHVGACIHLGSIPLSSAFKAATAQHAEQALLPIFQAVEAGDDYELCFTATKNKREQIEALQRLLPITRIGQITARKTLNYTDANGHSVAYSASGFTHF